MKDDSQTAGWGWEVVLQEPRLPPASRLPGEPVGMTGLVSRPGVDTEIAHFKQAPW